MKVRVEEKIEAIRLRRQGKTYSEIRAIIPNLPKGTLSGWIKNIELTDKQKERIIKKMVDSGENARAIQRQRGAWTNHLKRIKTTEQIIYNAKKEAKKRLNDPLFISGLMLYWAEGDKSLGREVVRFTNSDPVMVQLMMNWFRNICQVSEKRFRVSLWIHTLHCRRNVTNYWSKVTGIPLSQFNKTIVKPTTLKFRKRPLYNGTCAIKISDKNLFRRIVGWKIEVVKHLDSKENICPGSSMDRATLF